MPPKSSRDRDQVIVYLEERDREILERLAEATGLSRTELFRRGLWQLAGTLLSDATPGAALDYLVETATDADVPPDVSVRADHYLYGGGYAAWFDEARTE